MISVIVPIYNVEDYLDRCVNSIVNQTYKDLEIILVDDGSPDNCPALCDAWAEKDERIKVVHKSNGGLSDARNAGMRIATGEYISFIDSDDWVSLDFYDILLNAMVSNECDIAECEYIATDNSNESADNTETSSTVLSAKEALRQNLHGDLFREVVWNKLYKRAVAEIDFMVGKQHEDVFWTYQAIAKAKKCLHINRKLYYYFQRNDSIMGNNYSLKRLDSIDAIESKCNFICNNYSDFAGVAQSVLIVACMYNIQLLLNSDIDNKKCIAYTLADRAKRTGDDWKNHRDVSIKQRCWFRLFFSAPIITCKIRNLLGIGK